MTSPQEDYLARLERGLKPLPRVERKRIVDEMRGHLIERGDAAIDGLGPADRLAASFVEDYRDAKAKVFGGISPLGVFRLVSRIGLIALLWPLAAFLYFVATGAGYIGLLALFAPESLVFAMQGCCTIQLNSAPTAIEPGFTEQPIWKLAVWSLGISLACFGLATWAFLGSVMSFIVRPYIRPAFDAARARRLREADA